MERPTPDTSTEEILLHPNICEQSEAKAYEAAGLEEPKFNTHGKTSNN